jgi:hypothetical protein
MVDAGRWRAASVGLALVVAAGCATPAPSAPWTYPPTGLGPSVAPVASASSSLVAAAATPSSTASPIPTAEPTPTPTPIPTPIPTPTPARRPVDVEIVPDPKAIFAHQQTKTWCASAGVQIALAWLGLADTSKTFQAKLESRVGEWDSYADSHNGKWGPTAMTRALAAYGAPGYQVQVFPTRAAALRASAAAIERTHSLVLLLAWRGAHTWVMSGFRADADPAVFADANVSGAYILDPWYPWVSSIWGPSDPPATFQDSAEMVRNYLKWKRPEGRYPGRDGQWIAVIPTVVATR